MSHRSFFFYSCLLLLILILPSTSHPAFPITESTLAQLHCAAPHCPEKTFRIHLPTYNTIADDFSVGVDSAFDTFVPDESHFQNPRNASIVWYGSSILQGAVASRPGQIMTHEVSRNLDTLILYVSKLAVWRNIAVFIPCLWFSSGISHHFSHSFSIHELI